MLKLKNILVPIDLSENSTDSFFLGCNLANQNKGTLHLMHVIKPHYDSVPLINQEDLYRFRINNAREELFKFINEIPHPCANIKEVIKLGEPEEEILQYSYDSSIDLIVINSFGWTGKLNTLMGNTAKKIFNMSKVPVICLKNAGTDEAKDFSRSVTTAENWVG